MTERITAKGNAVSAVTIFESHLHAAWRDLSTDARADLEQTFADLKAQLAQLNPLLETFKADVKAALAAQGSDTEATVTRLVEKLLADAATIGLAA
jgi:hypothetical protein